MRDELARVLCQASAPTVDEVVAKACGVAFCDPVVANVGRGAMADPDTLTTSVIN
jgi:hypothetical protein